MSFKSLVAQNFNFLEFDFGFRSLKDGIGYMKDDLELEFYEGNGQVDINFFIRKNDVIFKPFISRSFNLNSIMRKVSVEKMEPYPKDIIGYLTEGANINLHLKYYARMLKEHGEDILNGDLTMFEQTHKKRRENAKKGT
jgi:hypothetical protein